MLHLLLILFVATIQVHSEYIGYAVNKDFRPDYRIFFVCKEYRQCYKYYNATFKYPDVSYVCFDYMETSGFDCFMTGKIDTPSIIFRSFWLNKNNTVMNNTIVNYNSFMKSVNKQCINYQLNFDSLRRFCIHNV
jgi:hypothetical protein